MGNNLFPSKN